MTVGARPIVGRELLVAARRSSTYWGRFQAALMALVVAGLIVVDQTLSSSAPAVMGALVPDVILSGADLRDAGRSSPDFGLFEFGEA
jgi:hypothetical protein